MKILEFISGVAAIAAITTASLSAEGGAGAPECVKHTSSSAGAAVTSGPSGTAAPERKTAAPARQLLFFMNPNGRPCQMQLGIIDGMKDKLATLASVTFIKTTESADRAKFSEFGIRGLPSLIILDASGKELKRLTPGIQDEATILAALKNSGN
jgi:thioredoxin 1